MVFDDYYDFPYENIGFDTPYDEGGVLMCSIAKEQNRNCQRCLDIMLRILEFINLFGFKYMALIASSRKSNTTDNPH